MHAHFLEHLLGVSPRPVAPRPTGAARAAREVARIARDRAEREARTAARARR